MPCQEASYIPFAAAWVALSLVHSGDAVAEAPSRQAQVDQGILPSNLLSPCGRAMPGSKETVKKTGGLKDLEVGTHM